MTGKELRELTAEELQNRLDEEKASLFTLRMQVATAQLDNVSRIKQVKRDIARIKTIMREAQESTAS